MSGKSWYISFGAVIVLVVAIVFGFNIHSYLVTRDNYMMTAVYCNYYGNNCVYRVRGVKVTTCPGWWDNSGSFDKVNNLKLKSDTCRITKQVNRDGAPYIY